MPNALPSQGQRTLLAATLCLAAAGTQAQAKDISALEANAELQAGKVTLIDIRRPDEWRQTGIAKGARRVNMIQPGGAQGFLDALLKETGGRKDAPIALICRTGNRTTQLQKFLEMQGFTNVANVKEGMVGSSAGPGWMKRGLPVEDCSRC
jgi:rhodanese-related sulfurtransferase